MLLVNINNLLITYLPTYLILISRCYTAVRITSYQIQAINKNGRVKALKVYGHLFVMDVPPEYCAIPLVSYL